MADLPRPPEEDDGGPQDPVDALRLVVRSWSDTQLRAAWALTARRETIGPVAAAQREVLLEEWERRHPRDPWDWEGMFLR